MVMSFELPPQIHKNYNGANIRRIRRMMFKYSRIWRAGLVCITLQRYPTKELNLYRAACQISHGQKIFLLKCRIKRLVNIVKHTDPLECINIFDILTDSIVKEATSVYSNIRDFLQIRHLCLLHYMFKKNKMNTGPITIRCTVKQGIKLIISDRQYWKRSQHLARSGCSWMKVAISDIV